MKFVDTSLPKEEQVPFTFREFAQKKAKEIDNGKTLTRREIEELHEIHKGQDPTTMRLFKSKVSRERVSKWHPELTETDLEKEDSDEHFQLYLDPEEYRDLVVR